MSALYTVEIERRRPEDAMDKLFFGGYRWRVTVQPDPTSTATEWELRGSGGAHSIEGAKKKALKHIMGVDHDIQEGMKFGMVLNVVGTAQEIKKQFEKVDYES